MRWDRWAVLAAVLVAALGWLAGPRPTELGGESTGDAQLGALVRSMVDDPTGYRGLAVAYVTRDAVRIAGLGDDGTGGRVGADTRFEIGSIGKPLTGMLLADLARDGTVHPDTPLRDLLPTVDFEDPDTAAKTAEELASHRSGLPSVRITGPVQGLSTGLSTLGGTDPYAGADTEWLLSTVGTASASGGAQGVGYSNYGMAVLGHALAQRAGVPYPELLRQRLLDPLGMTATGYALPSPHAQGFTAGGRSVDPWRGSGYAPAGVGAWSTAADLATLVSATMDGSAPGAAAADPRFDAGDGERIGYGWFTEPDGITWHNGGTGGFSAYLGFDRSAGRGVVVLGNTDRSVDDLGRRLLGTEGEEGGFDVRGAIRIGVTVFLSLAGAWGLLSVARQPATDRLRLVSNAVWAVALPALAYAVGTWQSVPPLVWAVGAGLSGYAAVRAARRWPSAPTNGRTRYPWLRWTTTAVNVALAAALVTWAVIL
ncbi:serine hydrolase domain-containing protein [Phytohabitans sp. ZYX-F-186]|uniref:Serine hydrolase domain-containing protein n=1 Tax=Phytohabitans maris TaxID=3071409 RepID=A0ABU0ZBB4_9ACTN|nr:serine hydrolase domain-containing protein [Phytohabitans sp. ZYX-F-186]MDQ7904347.1 serine hydrolase domain-containing protein [Phytohabitans sp. ZYX-F-186]